MTAVISEVSLFTGGFAVQKARLTDSEDGGVRDMYNVCTYTLYMYCMCIQAVLYMYIIAYECEPQPKLHL